MKHKCFDRTELQPVEIDAELEATFDQMHEEREITGNIRPGWG